MQLALLAFATVVAIFLRPAWVIKYQRGGRGWLIPAIWAVAGVGIWLVLLFFGGSLTSIDRLYPLAQIATLAGLLIIMPVRPHRAAIGFGVLTILWSQDWQSLKWTADTAATTGVTDAVSRLSAKPYVVPLSFLAAAVLPLVVLRRRLASDSNFMVRSVSLVAWIIVTHFLWLCFLFLAGAADVPRYLPLLTALVMTVSSVVVPLLYNLWLDRSVLAAKLYDPGLLAAPGAAAELVPGTGRGTRRAWVISYTGVSNEPRVLRQCEALTADGWDVVVCGYDGHSTRPPEWQFIRLPTTAPFSGRAYKLLALAQNLGRWIVVHGPTSERLAVLVHRATPLWLHTNRELVRLAQAHPELKADLVIGHDYHTADAAYAVAQHYGAKFSVDVHEYAAGQYFNDPKWVKWDRPISIGVQRYYLGKADVVTVVCQGIADHLAKENTLRREPMTIRSVPFKAVQPFKPVGKRIEVLYHGDLSTRREIHTLVQSMPLWRKDIDLVLRGSGDPAYIADIKRQIARLNMVDRVRWDPPVPFHEIIPAANRSDIGFFSFNGDSPQIRFTLPNKFFEYIMAGLCLCVGDTEEVGRLVRHYGTGRLISPHSPQSIADAINSLSPREIEDFKRASIKAADELNWELERQRLLDAYKSIL